MNSIQAVRQLFHFHSRVMIPVHVQYRQTEIQTNHTQFLDLVQVMFKPIFRRGKMYVGCQYTNFITCSESC